MGIEITDLGGSLSYRRLSVLLANASRDSAFNRSVAGESAEWTLTDHLLALVWHQLALGNWQRSGGKGPRPKPIQRPGASDKDETRIGGGTVLPFDQLRKRLRGHD